MTTMKQVISNQGAKQTKHNDESHTHKKSGRKGFMVH